MHRFLWYTIFYINFDVKMFRDFAFFADIIDNSKLP